MDKIIRGVFLSDLHLPYNINLKGVFDFLGDYKPHQIILGGDIVDGPDYGVDGWKMEDVERRGFYCYKRDVALILELCANLEIVSPKSELIFLDGNHEERYDRLVNKYPKALKSQFNLKRDVGIIQKWIKYGDYDSFYKVGDCLFTHGTLYPDAHAKKMAQAYAPLKTVYGHIHDFQAYTTHSGDPRKPARYALTAGCLCGRLPDYKNGMPNKWTNGFVSWVSINGVTTPTPHIIENGKFEIGGTIYG